MNKENRAYVLPCEVVQDLLPLYHDQVVSDVTAAAVKTHLDTCQSCRTEYDALCVALPEQEKVESTGKKFKALVSKQKWKKLVAILLAVVLTAAAVTGAGAILSEWCVVPVPADVKDVCLIDTPAGKHIFICWLDTYSGITAASQHYDTADGENTLAVEHKHPILKWGNTNGFEKVQYWFLPVETNVDTVTFNGETVWTADEGIRAAPDYVYRLWELEQELHEAGGGLSGYGFEDDYVYLQFLDGHEEYWSYDGQQLDGPIARK